MERTPFLTVVIATAPYHIEVVEEAVQSVIKQTVICNCVVVYDHERRGAGWARNRGLEQTATPFVTFLDSDDLLLPTFAEDMLRHYDGKRYVFSDWITDKVIQAPCRPWDGTGAHHIVTTLLPTSFVRHVGGFDEALTGMEDTDLGWKLTRSGLCGRRLAKPLVQYRKGGLRAQAFRDRPDRDAIAKSIIQQYEGKPMPSNCTDCGGNELNMPDLPPSGDKAADDVLAEALWNGNRQERGRATGRLYPKSGWGKKLWVDPRDIDAAPHLFARVISLPPPVREDDLQAFRQFSGQVRQVLNGGARDTTQDPVPAYAPQGEVAPDVGQVIRLYQQHT